MQIWDKNVKMERYFCFQDARFDGEGLRGGGGLWVLIFNKTSGTTKMDQILLVLLNMHYCVPIQNIFEIQSSFYRAEQAEV